MNSLRLALGTLTVLPVPAPTSVDRRTAGLAMVVAPLVGVLLGGLAVLPALLPLSPLLQGVLVVAALALLTRGLHLDGLADTADGLGSRRPAAGALEVMRKSDVGPFGVATLVLVLLVQAAAVASVLPRPGGALAVVAAVTVSRLALPLACLRGVPSARPDGLGHLVAGAVAPVGAVVAVGLTGLVVTAASLPSLTGASGAVGAVGAVGAGQAALAALVGLAAGAALVAHCVRRLGGVTGDVLGACVETALTAALLVLALG